MNHVRPANAASRSEHHLRDALREQIMGFRTTQMIHVAAKLGLADRLAAGPRPVEALAAAVGAEPQALHRLLRALASLGIFAQDEAGDFALTPQAELLRSDVQGSLRDIALMYGEDWLWQAYGNMTHSVRTGAPAFTKTHGQPFYGYLHAHPRAAARFNAAMNGFSSHETAAILEAYDFSDARSVVDIGGGHGALLAALLRAHPQLTGTVFDLPSVVAGAAAVLSELDERVRTRRRRLLRRGAGRRRSLCDEKRAAQLGRRRCAAHLNHLPRGDGAGRAPAGDRARGAGRQRAGGGQAVRHQHAGGRGRQRAHGAGISPAVRGRRPRDGARRGDALADECHGCNKALGRTI